MDPVSLVVLISVLTIALVAATAIFLYWFLTVRNPSQNTRNTEPDIEAEKNEEELSLVENPNSNFTKFYENLKIEIKKYAKWPIRGEKAFKTTLHNRIDENGMAKADYTFDERLQKAEDENENTVIFHPVFRKGEYIDKIVAKVSTGEKYKAQYPNQNIIEIEVTTSPKKDS